MKNLTTMINPPMKATSTVPAMKPDADGAPTFPYSLLPPARRGSIQSLIEKWRDRVHPAEDELKTWLKTTEAVTLA